MFSEYVRTASSLSDERMLGFTFDEMLVIVDQNDNNASITPLVSGVSAVFLSPLQSDYIFVAADVEQGQLFPIWAVNMDKSEPILIGLASGAWPLYSATSYGKVVFVEDGHLVLKWIEGNNVRRQPLNEIEEKLELNWDQFDLTQMPYHEGVPLVDLSISPNGEWLAVFDGLREKFWLITIDGETVHEVPFPSATIAPGEGSRVYFREWSPDSQWISYQVGVWIDSSEPVNREFSQLKIVSINDSNNSITLAASPSLFGIEVVWSPDGDHLAFSTINGTRLTHPSGWPVEYLFLADDDGTNIKQISRFLAGDSVKSIYWASDSQSITFKCQNPDDVGRRGELCEFDINR